MNQKSVLEIQERSESVIPSLMKADSIVFNRQEIPQGKFLLALHHPGQASFTCVCQAGLRSYVRGPKGNVLFFFTWPQVHHQGLSDCTVQAEKSGSLNSIGLTPRKVGKIAALEV